MNEPPDENRGGPSLFGLNLPVGSSISVVSNNDDSKMDTDGSVSSRTGETGRKRTSYLRICRQCTKRRKKKVPGMTNSNANYCQCEADNDSDNSILLKKVTPEMTHQAQHTKHVNDKSHHVNANTTTNSQSAKLQNTSSSSQSDTRQVGRSEYLQTDASPYVIHVQRVVNSPNDGTILHPIAFGNFLKKNNFQNIVPGSVKKIGRNRCTVAFSNSKDANEFLQSDLLHTNRFKAFIPSFNVTRIGLVRGIPTDWSDDEILANITTPIGCGKILKVRRLNYKVQVNGTSTWKPSQSVVLTFDGQVLPKRIFICYNALPVDIYIYPTIQCFRCCNYGHTKTLCRSSMPRCYKCGAGHLGESCSKEEDSAYCIMCGGFHYATSKTCPEFNRQKEIKMKMAHSCISYAEASKSFPPTSKSYADVLNSRSTVPNSSYILPNPTTSPIRTSSKKTVFLKPRTPPKVQSGYDRAAHNSVLKEFEMPASENGCALVTKDTEPNDSVLQTILTLISTLLQSNIFKPSHVAPITELLRMTSTIHNGFENNPVELQKYNS